MHLPLPTPPDHNSLSKEILFDPWVLSVSFCAIVGKTFLRVCDERHHPCAWWNAPTIGMIPRRTPAPRNTTFVVTTSPSRCTTLIVCFSWAESGDTVDSQRSGFETEIPSFRL